jgi:hypothetical protein
MRATEEYISKLGKKAALYELSHDLEKEVAPERMEQLREMEAEVKKLRAAWEVGNMAGIAHRHKVLKDQLEKYHGGFRHHQGPGEDVLQPHRSMAAEGNGTDERDNAEDGQVHGKTYR